MGRRAKYPTQVVVDVYRQLMNVSATGRVLGLSRGGVAYHLRKAGVKIVPPPPSTPPPIRKTRLYDLNRTPLIKSKRVLDAVDLARMGLSNREIAQNMGVSEKTVAYYLELAFNPKVAEAHAKKLDVYRRRSERKRLMRAVEQLSPEVRKAVMKVFGDMLGEG